jgi:hypothetical protein
MVQENVRTPKMAFIFPEMRQTIFPSLRHFIFPNQLLLYIKPASGCQFIFISLPISQP